MRLTRRRSLIGATLLAVALLATGCTGAGGAAQPAPDETSAGNSSDAFPVTIEHQFGETVINEKPERIVSLDPAATDQLLSLGIVPDLTMPQPWSGDEDGYNTWTRGAIENLGAELPPTATFTTQEIDFEAILSYDPQLIFATSFGFDETAYQRLSEIAPTLALPTELLRAPWQDEMRTTAAAVGEPKERAEAVIAETEAVLAAVRAEHPEFEGRSVLFSRALREGDTASFAYSAETANGVLFAQLGFVPAPISDVPEEELVDFGNTISFSLEELDSIETDLWIGFAFSDEDVETTLSNPLMAAWEPFATGNFYMMTDRLLTQALSFSTPLSIEWGIPRIANDVSDVIANAQG